jgi:uncharacterized protein
MVTAIKPRIVFDTNVLLSALLFQGSRVRWIIPLWQQGKLVPLLSKETAGELLRVLAYPKFKLTHEEQQCVLHAFVPYVETVSVRALHNIPVCRDPHDQKFLTLAIDGHADYLVTGDDDLLAIDNIEVCPIITPEAFRQIMPDVSGQG